MYANRQLESPWNSTSNSNSTLVVSSPLYLKLAIKVERKSRNSSVLKNFTASNPKARIQNKPLLDLAGLFSSIPSIFSARRKTYKKEPKPHSPNSTSVPLINTSTAEQSNPPTHEGKDKSDNISVGKKERNVFNIPLPPEITNSVKSRRQDKPSVKNLPRESTTTSIMFGNSQSLTAIVSVMAAAVTLTILLHLLFFPIIFKKFSSTSRIIQKFLGIKVKEKGSPAPSKQRTMTPAASVKSSSRKAVDTPISRVAATPVSSELEVTVIEEDASSRFVKHVDAEVVSPTILITKREPQSLPRRDTPLPPCSSSSNLKSDILSTSLSSADHLDMCAIYKESNDDGFLDPIDNPIHLEGKWPGDMKRNGFVPNYRDVPEPGIVGSNDSDGLLRVYEQENYFVDDNPLCADAAAPAVTRKLSKKLLFPSFMYNNPHIRCEEADTEGKSMNSSMASDHNLEMSSLYEDSSFCKDDVNPLVISTSQSHGKKESLPLSSGATTHSTGSNNSTRLGRPKLFSPTFADQAAVLSPLKMKSKCPSFLLPSGRKSITRDEFDSCYPFNDDEEDESDEDYDDSSIHSFSFSTQTFSPPPHSTRESTATKGQSSLMMSFGISPQIIVGGETAPSSTPRANSLETVSTAPGSWIDGMQQEIVEEASSSQRKSGSSNFVRPKAPAAIGDLTPEQLKALSQLYRGNGSSNYDNVVHNIDGSSDSSAKDIQRQPSQASSMNNSSHYYSTNRSVDARMSSNSIITKNALLSQSSPTGATNMTTPLQHARQNSRQSNGSNVSAISGSSGSSSFVSNFSRPIIAATHLASSGAISNKSSSINSVPSGVTIGSDPRKAKSSGQKVDESENLKSPEKSTPTGDFFRRCVSPYKAVSQFVRRTLSPSPTKRQQHSEKISRPHSPAQQAPKEISSNTSTASLAHGKAPKGISNISTGGSPTAASKRGAATATAATAHSNVSSGRLTSATSKSTGATAQKSSNTITSGATTKSSSAVTSAAPKAGGLTSTYSGMFEKKKSFSGQSFLQATAVVNSNLLKPGSSLVRKSSFNSSHHSHATPIARAPPLHSSPPSTGATITSLTTATNSSAPNSPQRPSSGVKGNRLQ